MRFSYKYKILSYFLLVLTAASLLFTLIVLNRESSMKVEGMVLGMKPYADIIYRSIEGSSSAAQIKEAVEKNNHLLPQNIRVTVLDHDAWVLYDNLTHKDSITDNHLDRPELEEASQKGKGVSLRYSSTLGGRYLYYAVKYPDYFVRTALEYDSYVYPALKSDKTWQIYILLVLFLSAIVLVYITRKINKPFAALKEFIDKVKHGEENYDTVRFPKDEMGELGEQIISTFVQLENTKKYKQQLTHNVAHELKTPVTGIRGYLETLLQQENIEQSQARFFLERAYAQTLRLSAIVNDMSILNKIEEAADKFDYEQINIHDCLKEIESDLLFRMEERGVKFFSEVSRDLVLEGNYMLIYSLFKNLIDNSIDHGGSGIEIHIKEMGVSGNEILFSYYDTGKGVSENHIHRIFERFYRVEKGRSRKSGGSGLGLSIVRNSVLLHRGRISVKNRPEGGLQFDFTLALKLE